MGGCLRVREDNYLLKGILRNAYEHVHDQSHTQCFFFLNSKEMVLLVTTYAKLPLDMV